MREVESGTVPRTPTNTKPNISRDKFASLAARYSDDSEDIGGDRGKSYFITTSIGSMFGVLSTKIVRKCNKIKNIIISIFYESYLTISISMVEPLYIGRMPFYRDFEKLQFRCIIHSSKL